MIRTAELKWTLITRLILSAVCFLCRKSDVTLLRTFWFWFFVAFLSRFRLGIQASPSQINSLAGAEGILLNKATKNNEGFFWKWISLCQKYLFDTCRSYAQIFRGLNIPKPGPFYFYVNLVAGSEWFSKLFLGVVHLLSSTKYKRWALV